MGRSRNHPCSIDRSGAGLLLARLLLGIILGDVVANYYLEGVLVLTLILYTSIYHKKSIGANADKAAT